MDNITLHNNEVRLRYVELYYIATHYYRIPKSNIMIMSCRDIIIKDSTNWSNVYMKYILLDRLYHYITSHEEFTGIYAISLHQCIKYFWNIDRLDNIRLLNASKEYEQSIDYTESILPISCFMVFCYSFTF